jgi:hypothetical protein
LVKNSTFCPIVLPAILHTITQKRVKFQMKKTSLKKQQKKLEIQKNKDNKPVPKNYRTTKHLVEKWFIYVQQTDIFFCQFNKKNCCFSRPCIQTTCCSLFRFSDSNLESGDETLDPGNQRKFFELIWFLKIAENFEWRKWRSGWKVLDLIARKWVIFKAGCQGNWFQVALIKFSHQFTMQKSIPNEPPQKKNHT